jgi:hypothetical protein
VSEGLVIRKYQYISAPRTQGLSITTSSGTSYGVGSGLVAVLNVTMAPQMVALQLLFAPPANAADAMAAPDASGLPPGCLGSYLSLEADGVDVGVVFGPTAASVQGSNSPSLAAAGTVNSLGVYKANGAECWRLYGSVSPTRGFLLAPLVDAYMGFVGSANSGFLRFYQSCPPPGSV